MGARAVPQLDQQTATSPAAGAVRWLTMAALFFAVLAAGRMAIGAERLWAAVPIDPHIGRLGRACVGLAEVYAALVGRGADAAWAKAQAQELGTVPPL